MKKCSNKKRYKVVLPKWWTEQEEEVVGYTDKIPTFLCCLEPSYFVEVPEFEWEGYFGIRDLAFKK